MGIERRLTAQQLSPGVRAVLARTVERIIRPSEVWFIECFNTTILDDVDGHPLSLLPDLSPAFREAISAAQAQRRIDSVHRPMEDRRNTNARRG